MSPRCRAGALRLAAALAALLLAAAPACSGRSSQGYADREACRPGETCGFARRTHWTGNCCGYALGPFPDSQSCRVACSTHGKAMRRSAPGCVEAGQVLCDGAVDDWAPCNGASGAREVAGGCRLPGGATAACVCR